MALRRVLIFCESELNLFLVSNLDRFLVFTQPGESVLAVPNAVEMSELTFAATRFMERENCGCPALAGDGNAIN